MTPGSFVWHIFLNLGCFPWLAPTLRLSHLRPPCSRPMFVKGVIGIFYLNYHQVEGGEVHRVVANPAFQAWSFQKKKCRKSEHTLYELRKLFWVNSCLEKVPQVVQPWLRLYRLSVFTSLDCNITLYYLLWARWAAKASLPSSNYLFVATGSCWRRIASLLNQPNVWLASEFEPHSRLQCLVFTSFTSRMFDSLSKVRLAGLIWGGFQTITVLSAHNPISTILSLFDLN